jgi:hypothetical protein
MKEGAKKRERKEVKKDTEKEAQKKAIIVHKLDNLKNDTRR